MWQENRKFCTFGIIGSTTRFCTSTPTFVYHWNDWKNPTFFKFTKFLSAPSRATKLIMRSSSWEAHHEQPVMSSLSWAACREHGWKAVQYNEKACLQTLHGRKWILSPEQSNDAVHSCWPSCDWSRYSHQDSPPACKRVSPLDSNHVDQNESATNSIEIRPKN